MKRLAKLLFASCLLFFTHSCSKKTVPTQTTPGTYAQDRIDSVVVNKPDSALAKKPVVKPKKKPAEPVAKMITVNDRAAKKTIDGRYYYDLLGHRYWRSNKDGKYYLYNKSMHDDPAFQSPIKK